MPVRVIDAAGVCSLEYMVAVRAGCFADGTVPDAPCRGTVSPVGAGRDIPEGGVSRDWCPCAVGNLGFGVYCGSVGRGSWGLRRAATSGATHPLPTAVIELRASPAADRLKCEM